VAADVSPRSSVVAETDEHHTPTDSKWPSGTFVLEVCLSQLYRDIKIVSIYRLLINVQQGACLVVTQFLSCSCAFDCISRSFGRFLLHVCSI